MRVHRTTLVLLFVALTGALTFELSKATTLPAGPQVALMRTPHNGIQPQTVLDRHGVLHMIYFQGDPKAGDIEYVRREPGAKSFSTPIRVNRRKGTAMAIGTVRGPQMALGRGGRVDVVWCGPRNGPPRPEGNATVYLARLNDAATAFEEQRDLAMEAKGVDGGLSVAADSRGDVYVVWHAMGEVPGEAHRRVYLARSTNDGKTFARQIPISASTLGACGCCGMRAFVDDRGWLYVFYRGATESIHRDMTLLVSKNRGETFSALRVGPWEINACPMSTAYLSQGDGGVFAAWEKAGQVYFDEINRDSLELPSPVAAPGQADDRKHPAIAANSRGQVLLAWTVGTAWSKGGSLAWQVFDMAGRPLGAEGHAPGVPVWGLPSVFVDPGGIFTIVY